MWDGIEITVAESGGDGDWQIQMGLAGDGWKQIRETIRDLRKSEALASEHVAGVSATIA